MRLLGRLIAAVVIGGVGVAGCVASGNGTATGVTLSATQHRATPPTSRVAAASPAPVDPPPAPAPPAPAPAPRVTHAATRSAGPAMRLAAPTVHPSARATAPAWDHFGGEVGDGPFSVGQAIGGGLPVSVHQGEPPAATLSNPAPSGAPRVVLVIVDAGDWLQVLLPMRPNDSLGWVQRSDVSISTMTYHAIVERASHRLRVYDGTQLIVDEAVAVGKPSTPTPHGQFFATELLRPSDPSGPYGPYAFGTSGYSDVYQTFGSGDGGIGLHGTNEPSSLGTDASHGCVRVNNDTIQHLASILPIGTPIAIR